MIIVTDHACERYAERVLRRTQGTNHDEIKNIRGALATCLEAIVGPYFRDGHVLYEDFVYVIVGRYVITVKPHSKRCQGDREVEAANDSED